MIVFESMMPEAWKLESDPIENHELLDLILALDRTELLDLVERLDPTLEVLMFEKPMKKKNINRRKFETLSSCLIRIAFVEI